MEERRKDKRILTDAVKIYRIEDNEETRIDTLISVDLSLAGLQIIVENKLPEDTRLNILLAVLPDKTPIAVSGKVVWVKDTEIKNQYNVGVEFVDFSDDVKKRIVEDYIRAS